MKLGAWIVLFFVMMIMAVTIPTVFTYTEANYLKLVGGERMELAIDVGVVKAEYDIDAGNGGLVRMDPDILKRSIQESFRQQMQLDGSLQNERMKDSYLSVKLVQNEDGTSVVECEFTTHVTVILTNQPKEVKIKKKIPVETVFN